MALPCKLMAYLVFSIILAVMGICTMGAAGAAVGAANAQLSGDCVDNGQKWVDAVEECNGKPENLMMNKRYTIHYYDGREGLAVVASFGAPVIGAGVVAFIFGVLGLAGAKMQNKSMVITATVFMGVCLVGFAALGFWSGIVGIVISAVCTGIFDYSPGATGNEDTEKFLEDLFKNYGSRDECKSVSFPKAIAKDDLYGQKCDDCGSSTVWYSCQTVMDATCREAANGLQLAAVFCYVSAVVAFVGSIIGCTACCCDDANNSVWVKGEDAAGDVSSG